MTTYEEGRAYDVVFAGGGTAACAAAGRLAMMDPKMSILIVEAGKSNLNDPAIVHPALFLGNLAPGAAPTVVYTANKEKALNDRESMVAAGSVLGGSSSINLMMYSRGQSVDYDSWKTEGWDSETMLRLAKRSETYHLTNEGVDQNLHGHDGPINISLGTYGQPEVRTDILAAAASQGLPEVADLQDFKTSHGVSQIGRYVSKDGRRQDAAHCYIHPLVESGKAPNLHLLLETSVNRVLFEGKRAVGIEVCKKQGAGNASGVKSTIKANKLVVVSAGALGTPSILERSGVGSAELLQKLEIPVVSDIEGVGEHYQDHQFTVYPFKTNLTPEQTLDGIFSGRFDVQQGIEDKNPILGWNGVELGAKVRLSEEEVSELGQDFKERYERDFAPHPSKPALLMAFPFAFFGHHLLSPEESSACQFIGVACYTPYPYSRGSIHIVSPDPQKAASFHTGYLSDPMDLKMLVYGYKKGREIFRRTNAYRGELGAAHPSFPEGSKAALVTSERAAGEFKSAEERQKLPKIEYGPEDDAAIEELIRNTVATTWHSLGTCKMAPREDGGVVDKNLNVYGTEGLKVADMSIPPENVGSNTYNTALIIGEKAADIIANELGYSV